MKRTLCVGALLVVAMMPAACGFDILEDIGTDPHPPAVTITALVAVDPDAPKLRAKSLTAPPRGKAVAFDSKGLTLKLGEKFQIERSYSDAGGDIVKFVLRDLENVGNNKDFPPEGQTYYSGTTGTVPYEIETLDGTVVVPAEEIELTGIFGRHRLEFWAEDSHLSRSEKVEFVITLVER